MHTVLTIIAIFLGMLVLIFAALYLQVSAIGKRNQTNAVSMMKQSQIENLLADGRTGAARDAAQAWCRAQPRSPAAFMLLAKAHFQLGEMVETKRILDELLDFSPGSAFTARPYYERIEKALREHRPQAVD